MNFTYVSLFSGIGGFEQALNQLGGTCVLASEFDKYADNAYATLYGHHTAGDVTKIKTENVPDHDFLVGGFPCQAFSTEKPPNLSVNIVRKARSLVFKVKCVQVHTRKMVNVFTQLTSWSIT